MSLKDKIVVITGGTRGIGLSVAKKFISEGSTVIITGTSEESTKKGLENLAGKAHGFALNLAHSEEVKEVFKNIIEQFSTVDVLVNNAGITQDTLAMRMKDSQWDDVINVNLKGTFLCCRAVIRPMMKARYGKIINMSSVVGLTGNIGQANYSASKAGVLGLTKSFAKEFASRNICVNAIAPGFIETEMTDAMTEDAKKYFLEHIPLQRMGKGEEIAELTCFLAGKGSDYITGQVICVDGGLVM